MFYILQVVFAGRLKGRSVAAKFLNNMHMSHNNEDNFLREAKLMM